MTIPAHDDDGPERATMHCLGCDYTLDGLMSRTCPECGRAFDPDQPHTYRLVPHPVVLNDPVQIARLRISDAVLLRARLDERGILSAINEELAGVIAYAEVPAASVWVERDDESRARQIMNEAPRHTHEPNWVCPNCHERIQGQFELCWNCGSERPDHVAL